MTADGTPIPDPPRQEPHSLPGSGSGSPYRPPFVCAQSLKRTSPPLLRFDHKAASLPPLSLAEITRQPAPSLSFAPDRIATRPPLPRSTPRDRFSSDPRWPMPVIKPDDAVDYKMAVVQPDPAVDYKLEIRSPDGDARAPN